MNEESTASASGESAADESASDESSNSALRRKLALAMLPHVPFDGWGRKALAHAAADLHIAEEAAMAAFRHPGAEAIGLWFTALDAALDSALDSGLAAPDAAAEPERLRRLQAAVRARVEALQPYREAARRALSFLALPSHALVAARLLRRTATALWTAAGGSNDHGGLRRHAGHAAAAGLYSATLLFWLGDDSDGQQETWAFLSRRVARARHASTARRRLKTRLKTRLHRRCCRPAADDTKTDQAA